MVKGAPATRITIRFSQPEQCAQIEMQLTEGYNDRKRKHVRSTAQSAGKRPGPARFAPGQPVTAARIMQKGLHHSMRAFLHDGRGSASQWYSLRF
jgi:hypothetical protein